VVGRYPGLDEVRVLGISVYEPYDVRKVADMLDHPACARAVLAANRRTVHEGRDAADLPAILAETIVTAPGTRRVGSGPAGSSVWLVGAGTGLGLET
jgi:hypothetical protein